MSKRGAFAFLTVALMLVAAPARATFHLWDITEVYSNVDGSVQFIELFTSASGQDLLNGRALTSTSDGVVKTFTFPANLPSSATANKYMLIATAGFARIPGAPKPDYTLPCGAFFNPNAASITINFASVDSITFAGSTLPKDGTNSLTDTNPSGTNLVAGASSPTNFTGATLALSLTGCLAAGTCGPCDDGLFCNGIETCSGSACVAGTPCALICNESNDTCVECNTPADCNDDNACTDDACTSNKCVHTDNSASCNDGKFCTLTDVCSGGTCVGSGEKCPGQICDEATDACWQCASAADCNDDNPCTNDSCVNHACAHANNTNSCNDGKFCTLTDVCSGGTCMGSGEKCPGQICDEATDACWQCASAADCNDDNLCTTDSCVSHACVHANNALPCDDGLFCTLTDACSGGKCVGSGARCPNQGCNEGIDACGNCFSDAECDDGNPCTADACVQGNCVKPPVADGTACPDDGVFCNGTETCKAGECVGSGNPCPSVQHCDEQSNACKGFCGNGVLDSGEACDDANTTNDDGCSSTCAIEPGFSCDVTGSPSVCTRETGTGGAGGTSGGGGQSAAGAPGGGGTAGASGSTAVGGVGGAMSGGGSAGSSAGGESNASGGALSSGGTGGSTGGSGTETGGSTSSNDAGISGGSGSPGSSGCSCRSSRPSSSGTNAAVFALLGLLGMRRRARRRLQPRS